MKIIYIHQYFNFPHEPGGTRSYWIAKKLIKKGFSVKIVTSTYNKKIKAGNYTIDGINITYLPVYYDQKTSNFKKFYSFLKFAFLSTFSLLIEKNIDIIYCTSTPLTVGIPGLIVSFLKKNCSLVFEVRDLWPRAPIELGIIKNLFLIKILNLLEKIIYNRSKLIIALSPGMKKGVLKVSPKSNVIVIPNMSKPDIFFPRKIDNSLFEKYDLNPNSFKVIYFGAMGPSNNINYAVSSAKDLQNSNIDFIFIGHGKDSNIVSECNLKNVFFLGHLPMKETSEIVSLCHISLVLFAPYNILKTNSPNKLFDSLSSGVPIIVNSNGWTKKLVEKYSCGFYADPYNSKDLSKKIKILSINENLRNNFSINSRKISLTIFDKELLTEKIFNSIKSLKNVENTK